MGSFRKTREITIEMARGKLGERGKRMSDKQIADLLSMLRFVCNKAIDSVVESNYDKSINLL